MGEKGFGEPTEIQKLAIPIAESGSNCLIIAPTGYGKTECALLPIFDFILKQREEPGIVALYITPLKALNRDMMERVEWWSGKLGISASVRHGDTSQTERARQAKHPPQLLITTPETLQAILPSRLLGDALKNVEKVVIDEVHELYSDKRGAQLAIALERLLEKRGGRAFQRIGLSATVGNPEKVAEFLCGDRECKIARLPVERAMHLRVESPKPVDEDYKLAEQLFVDGAAAARLRLMDGLIRSHTGTLAFVNTRSIAETLTSRLLRLRQAEEEIHQIAIHHGSLSREVRIRAEQRFKGKELKGLVCTSSLELGMDIGQVDLVIQYSSPRQVQRLVQRVGRSGHSISKTPKGVVIAADEDDIAEAAVIARRAAKGLLESDEEQTLALDVLANQVAGLLMEKEERKIEDTLSLIRRAHPFAKLTQETLARVCSQLQREGIAVFDEKNGIIRRTGRTRIYYYENLSMIPDQRRFFVKNAVTNSNIGTLDEGFVANFVDKGSTFISRGVPWKVLDVAEGEIIVEPAEDIAAAVPDWVGEEIPVPFEVAQEVSELWGKIAGGDEGIRRDYPLSEEAYAKLAETAKKQAALFLPAPRKIVAEFTPDALVLHCALGSKGNEALGRLLSALISQHTGHSVRAEADPYRIILQAADAKLVKRLLVETSPDFAENLLRQLAPKTALYRYKFVHVAKAFGLLAKDAEYSASGMRRIMEAVAGSPVHEETLRQFMLDYFDMNAVRNLLGGIRSGAIAVESVRLPEPSPLARLSLLKLSAASELIAPIEPSGEILRGFKMQVLAKTAKLFCTYCNRVHYRKISEIGVREKIKCTSCGSELVAAVDPREKAFPPLQKKLKEEKKLNAEEAKLRNELLRSAGLVQAYGRRAVAALGVYGVGVGTAARILQRLHRNEDLLFADLLEAQKQFIRTKRYWQA